LITKQACIGAISEAFSYVAPNVQRIRKLSPSVNKLCHFISTNWHSECFHTETWKEHFREQISQSDVHLPMLPI
jgi:hypothetical protein